MANHRFRIVNVFTHERGSLTGNPLCVFEDAANLDAATMQALARQFNLSETTFILPATHAALAGRADARVRIFTPSYEMPFAGHPTLGSAHVCRALGLGGDSLRLEMQAGIVPVEADGDRWTLTALTPTWRELDAPLAQVARALGLDTADIAERPLWVKAGKEQLIVPLRSPAAVRRAAPQVNAFGSLQNEDGMGMAYVFADDGDDRVLARFFFPQGTAMLEDPATGSATANFGGWCLAMQRPLPLKIEISQGALVGRPSSLYLGVDSERCIRVGGDVIALAQGNITL